MSIGTMNRKGQITIPKNVREDLGLKPVSTLRFERNDEGSYTVRPAAATHRAIDLSGSVPWDGPPVTLEEMDAAIAKGAAESSP